MRYAYDMLGNRIHQLSMEAGARWMLNDVAGKPIRAWDSRGHNFTHHATTRCAARSSRPCAARSDADPLNRLRPAHAEPRHPGRQDRVRRERRRQTRRALNLRTRIYRHFDSAGVATNAGSMPTATRPRPTTSRATCCAARAAWSATTRPSPTGCCNPQLDAETFEGSTRYDALNRPIQSIAPHSSLTRPGTPTSSTSSSRCSTRPTCWSGWTCGWNAPPSPPALLDPATEAPSPVGVANIDYDAKGQRLRIDYKNGATVIRTTTPTTRRPSG